MKAKPGDIVQETVTDMEFTITRVDTNSEGRTRYWFYYNETYPEMYLYDDQFTVACHQPTETPLAAWMDNTWADTLREWGGAEGA